MRLNRGGSCEAARRRSAVALLAFFATAPGLGRAQAPAPAATRAPIVLELYSSEGCSSCPSADQVLAQLDAAGQVGGVPVLALELHVDYWDYLGWRDPFSAADFTARQERYGKWLGSRSYTPQLVIDGQAEVLGSDRGRAAAAILAAARRPSAATVQLRRQGDALAVRVVAADAAARPTDAAVLLAITESGLRTKVLRGENAGQTLQHGPVVRALRPVGMMHGDSYASVVPLGLAKSWKPETLRAVVLVQSAKGGQILGAATLPLSATADATSAPNDR